MTLRHAANQILRRLLGHRDDAAALRSRLTACAMRILPGQLTCAEFEDFVHDYHEGTLGERERRVFELHMELCPMCRVHLASYLRAIEIGKRVCAEDDAFAELPDELVRAILEARAAEHRH